MIRIITLNRGNIMKRPEIFNILCDARATFEYAKFNLAGGIYITIIYNRDRTMEIATNSTNRELYHQITSLKRSYTQARLADFLFFWVNRINGPGYTDY